MSTRAAPSTTSATIEQSGVHMLPVLIVVIMTDEDQFIEILTVHLGHATATRAMMRRTSMVTMALTNKRTRRTPMDTTQVAFT
jgi:hypothetical protein